MAKKNHAKKALISSLLALFICFTMLIGTTFAWFTDTAVSSGNRIQAGKLEIGLDLLQDGQWVDASDTSVKIFDYDKWEPGYTEVKTLKIVNEGNLALKYQLNVVAENADCILANVIDVYMCFGESTATSAADLSDTSKWWECGTLAEMMANPEGFTQGKLLPTGASYDGDLLGQNGVAIGEITASIALHMQETAGNEYQGLDLGNIDVNLLATQFTYEEDSFDDQYDKDAEYATVVANDEELDTALAEGKTNLLLKPGVYTANLYDIAECDSLTINGSGANTKLSFTNLQVRASQFKNLTINNCTIERMPNKSWGHLVFGSSTTPGGVYTISNCVFNGVKSQGIYINQNVPATFNIKNCTFNDDFGGEGAIVIQNNDGVNITVNVTGCEFNDIPGTSHEICIFYEYNGFTLNVQEDVEPCWMGKPYPN